MKVMNYISALAMPSIILVIVLYGFSEKKKVFDLFLKGAEEGVKTVISLFPTLLGIFIAVGLIRNSGVLNVIINIIKPGIELLGFPVEIMPLAILRPISGSSSIAVATDIMKTYGVDSNIGLIASVIMGATETTLYTIAVYTSSVKIKKTRGILIASLVADIVGMITAVIVINSMW